MITVKADSRRRVQLPDAKLGQIFAYQDNGDDTITLIKVKAERKEPFPPGSLLKYMDEWNKDMAPVARKMKIPPSPEDWE